MTVFRHRAIRLQVSIPSAPMNTSAIRQQSRAFQIRLTRPNVASYRKGYVIQSIIPVTHS